MQASRIQFGALFILCFFGTTFEAWPQSHPLQDRLAIRALEDFKSELDLVIRNQKSTRIDLQRQEREFAWFRVFEAMPLEVVTRPVYLKRWVRPAIENAAGRYGIRIRAFKPVRNPAPTPESRSASRPPPVPKVVRTTDRPDWLKTESIVETIEIDLEGEGTLKNAQRWLGLARSPEDPSRETGPWIETVRLTSSKTDRWSARVRTYRFRPLNPPMIRSRDPLAMLPSNWPRSLPALRKSRPEIADLIDKIGMMRPHAEAAYRDRAQFMLNGARMSFYVKHGPGWSPRPFPPNSPQQH